MPQVVYKYQLPQEAEELRLLRQARAMRNSIDGILEMFRKAYKTVSFNGCGLNAKEFVLCEQLRAEVHTILVKNEIIEEQ